jgi:WD40 repeat protein
VNGDGDAGILMESSNEPAKMLEVAQNTDRITIVVFHPLANDVMASVSADYVIRVWDIQTGSVTIQLDPHPDQVTDHHHNLYNKIEIQISFLFLRFSEWRGVRADRISPRCARMVRCAYSSPVPAGRPFVKVPDPMASKALVLPGPWTGNFSWSPVLTSKTTKNFKTFLNSFFNFYSGW